MGVCAGSTLTVTLAENHPELPDVRGQEGKVNESEDEALLAGVLVKVASELRSEVEVIVGDDRLGVGGGGPEAGKPEGEAGVGPLVGVSAGEEAGGVGLALGSGGIIGVRF